MDAQLTELNGRLADVQKELVEITAQKNKAQAETADVSRRLADSESQAAQLSRLRVALAQQVLLVTRSVRLSVCLSVCRMRKSKSYKRIVMKFCGWVGHSPRRNWSCFDGDLVWIRIQNSLPFGDRAWSAQLQCISATYFIKPAKNVHKDQSNLPKGGIVVHSTPRLYTPPG